MDTRNYCVECDMSKPCDCTKLELRKDLLVYGVSFMNSKGDRISPNEIYKDENEETI